MAKDSSFSNVKPRHAEQKSVLLPTGKARERAGREETGKGRSGGEKKRAERTALFEF